MAHISSASARDSASEDTRDSASTRELEIIEKVLHPHCLLVNKVQNFFTNL